LSGFRGTFPNPGRPQCLWRSVSRNDAASGSQDEWYACLRVLAVNRGNSVENAEWIAEELRGLPKRLRSLAQNYEPSRSAGWLLIPNLEQAVWFIQAYGSDGRASYLNARAVIVSPASELPRNLERLIAWLEDLAFARTVLGTDRHDPFYLIYPEECFECALSIALLARYADQGAARLLPASRSTSWDEADGSWENRMLPARISRTGKSTVRVDAQAKNLTALRDLVERLRLEAPREVDLMCDETTRCEAELLAHLLVVTQGLLPRIVAS
jgi:hypothetical protein